MFIFIYLDIVIQYYNYLIQTFEPYISMYDELWFIININMFKDYKYNLKSNPSFVKRNGNFIQM